MVAFESQFFFLQRRTQLQVGIISQQVHRGLHHYKAFQNFAIICPSCEAPLQGASQERKIIAIFGRTLMSLFCVPSVKRCPPVFLPSSIQSHSKILGIDDSLFFRSGRDKPCDMNRVLRPSVCPSHLFPYSHKQKLKIAQSH